MGQICNMVNTRKSFIVNKLIYFIAPLNSLIFLKRHDLG